MKLLKNKRGGIIELMTIKNIIFLLLAIIAILAFCYINFVGCKTSTVTITETIISTTPTFLKAPLTNLFEKKIAGKSIESRMNERSTQIANILGYGRGGTQSFCLFFYDLQAGLLAGLLIYILFKIYTLERETNKKFFKLGASATKNSWLEMLGNSVIKILAIGFGYAVLMQVPFLNAAIDFICFDFLADGFWFDVIIRSFLIAFYIGIGPTAYSEYKRYKIKKAYQYATMRGVYRQKAQNKMLGN